MPENWPTYGMVHSEYERSSVLNTLGWAYPGMDGHQALEPAGPLDAGTP